MGAARSMMPRPGSPTRRSTRSRRRTPSSIRAANRLYMAGGYGVQNRGWRHSGPEQHVQHPLGHRPSRPWWRGRKEAQEPPRPASARSPILRWAVTGRRHLRDRRPAPTSSSARTFKGITAQAATAYTLTRSVASTIVDDGVNLSLANATQTPGTSPPIAAATSTSCQ